MDTAFLRKTFTLIAKGIIEKDQLLQKDPNRYPYSSTLQHGINMFLAASYQTGEDKNIMQYADETSFLEHFITKPISEWFNGWNSDVIDSLNLHKELFYNCGAFAYRQAENLYCPSPECYKYLERQNLS